MVTPERDRRETSSPTGVSQKRSRADHKVSGTRPGPCRRAFKKSLIKLLTPTRSSSTLT